MGILKNRELFMAFIILGLCLFFCLLTGSADANLYDGLSFRSTYIYISFYLVYFGFFAVYVFAFSYWFRAYFVEYGFLLITRCKSRKILLFKFIGKIICTIFLLEAIKYTLYILIKKILYGNVRRLIPFEKWEEGLIYIFTILILSLLYAVIEIRFSPETAIIVILGYYLAVVSGSGMVFNFIGNKQMAGTVCACLFPNFLYPVRTREICLLLDLNIFIPFMGLLLLMVVEIVILWKIIKRKDILS